MKANLFNDTLRNAQSRVTNLNTDAKFLLDKNELSNDMPLTDKQQVIESLLQQDWNRYPKAGYNEIEQKIASYCKVNKENIVLAPGSATIITTLLNYFALNKKSINILQPTYSLFDYHCKTYGIEYTPWNLTADLEFDYDNLPILNDQSVLFITSPNNPTGTSIDTDKLKSILTLNPKAIVIVDAVYTEFANYDITPLVNEYENLIVLRSFSKAFPVAGLRLGYLCANSEIATCIKKLILQFSITAFSLCFAEEILFKKHFLLASKVQIQEIKAERNKLRQYIQSRFNKSILNVYPSQGNFLMIKIINNTHFDKLMQDLNNHGIKILNTSKFPSLENTFRVSIGNKDENAFFLNTLINSLIENFYVNTMNHENSEFSFGSN